MHLTVDSADVCAFVNDHIHVISLALHISHNNIILQVTVFITTRTVRDQFLPEISSLVAKDQFLGLRSLCPRIAFPW